MISCSQNKIPRLFHFSIFSLGHDQVFIMAQLETLGLRTTSGPRHETAVLIETGIPPLEVTRKLQLAQFRYRLSHSPSTSLTFRMWNLWQPTVHRMNDTTLETCYHVRVCVRLHTGSHALIRRCITRHRTKTKSPKRHRMCSL